MEEEKRLPKNIRQMAEKEDRARVYLEDYAYTFVRKLNCTRRVRTGVLLGSHAIVEDKRCWFVKGAVEFEEESDQPQKPQEGLDENEKITKQTWDQTQLVIQEYFPDCSVCGWFICGSEENFPNGEQLKKTHRQIFSGENGLMYWRQGDEESFWIDEDDVILHLKGYYVYYEKNPQMQNYMLSREEETSENVSDEAAFQFRKIMKEKQDTKHPAKEVVHMGLWMKIGVAAILFVLITGGTLLSKGGKKNEDSIQALAVGASVERQSGEFEKESSEWETQSTAEENAQVEVSKSTENQTKSEDVSGENASDSTSDKKDVAAMQDGGIFSGDMMFYKDGLGASVYRITDKRTDESEQTQPEADENAQEENPDGQNAEAASQSTQEILTIEVPTAQAAVNRPASYTVQPGDTLIEISKKFYGSSQMVMQIKEANGLEDINKIYIGQELTLP